MISAPQEPDDNGLRRERATIRSGMRLSVLDGTFAVPYITVTSGVILTGFLIALGATEFQIGIVAALPLLAGLLQPIGAEIIRRRGGWRKPVVVGAILVDCSLWAVTLFVVASLDSRTAVLAVMLIILFQQAANSFVGVGWTSWMTDLVPPQLRGRYFGRRNFICNSAGVLTAVLAGQFIDRVGDNEVWGYLVMIGTGVCFRLVSAYFLYRQPEPRPAESLPGTFFDRIALPLAHPNFRTFVYFVMAWGFAVNLTAPFFTVYMVRTLEIDFSLVTLFAALATGFNLLGQRFWGPLCDRYGNHQIMMATGLSISLQPFWWLFTAADGFGFYLMAFLNVTGAFAWAGHHIATTNLMMRIAPEIGRTSFFGVQAAFGGAAGALGPFAGGITANYLMAAPGAIAWFLPVGLKALFLLSSVLRLTAWGVLLRRIVEPVTKPKFNMVLVLRETARTFNIQQGFSPLLHAFTWSDDRYRPQLKSPEVSETRETERTP